MPRNEAQDSIRAPVRQILFPGTPSKGVPPPERAIPVEWPVAIRYGGLSYAVMMTSPGDLVDFAYGFSLSEGVVDHAAQIRAVEVVSAENGVSLDIELSGATLGRHLQRQRTLTGRTGCGICGVEKLADLPRAQPRQGGFAPVPAGPAMQAGLAALEAEQRLNRVTRAVHAAAWCDANGRLIALREDVGRHNALDKLIGALSRQETILAGGFAVITSRCSFEMAEKAARCGLPVLVAISAPTNLAVERAKILGLTLLAVARLDAALLFAGPEEEGRMP